MKGREMMASTYVALKSQGLPTKRLTSAAALNYANGVGRNTHLPDQVAWNFWSEVVASRRAFRDATGVEIETIFARN